MPIPGLCGIKVYGLSYPSRIGNLIEPLSIKVLCLLLRRTSDRSIIHTLEEIYVASHDYLEKSKEESKSTKG